MVKASRSATCVYALGVRMSYSCAGRWRASSLSAVQVIEPGIVQGLLPAIVRKVELEGTLYRFRKAILRPQ